MAIYHFFQKLRDRAENITKGIASARKGARYRAQSILSTWLKPFSGAFRPKWN